MDNYYYKSYPYNLTFDLIPLKYRFYKLEQDRDQSDINFYQILNKGGVMI